VSAGTGSFGLCNPSQFAETGGNADRLTDTVLIKLAGIVDSCGND
jgi:hypothetical protein